MNIRKDYYPDEIATALCDMADNVSTEKIRDCENALYNLMAFAENPYNTVQRTLWEVLQDVTEHYSGR